MREECKEGEGERWLAGRLGGWQSAEERSLERLGARHVCQAPWLLFLLSPSPPTILSLWSVKAGRKRLLSPVANGGSGAVHIEQVLERVHVFAGHEDKGVPPFALGLFGGLAGRGVAVAGVRDLGMERGGERVQGAGEG